MSTNGKPLPRMSPSELERFERFYVVNIRSGCWEWIGSKHVKGYGQFYLRGRMVRAHRAAYTTFVGEIPAGLVLDHYVCDNPSCVRPSHVRPTTALDNVTREGSKSPAADQVKRTRCPRGHALAAGNLVPSELRRGVRRCLTCDRAGTRLWKAQNPDRLRAQKRRAYARKRAAQQAQLDIAS